MSRDHSICEFCDEISHDDDCLTIYFVSGYVLLCKWCFEDKVKDCVELVTKGDDNKGTDDLYKIIKEFKVWKKIRRTMSPD